MLVLCFFYSQNADAEYNLATKKEEIIFFSTAREVKLGNSIAQKVERKFKLAQDAKSQERLEKIGQEIVAVCDRKDIVYCFRLIKAKEVNAFSLPGGYVYVNSGLMDQASSDDELAGVLAHEIGHIVARHSVKRLQNSLGYSLLSILAIATTKDMRVKRGLDLAFMQLMMGYSREDEFLADELSIKYLEKAGYDSGAVITFLKKLQEIEEKKPRRPLVPSIVRTHPYLPERIAASKEQVYGKMDFTDYINKRMLE